MTQPTRSAVYMVAASHAHPAGVLTNAELERTVPDLAPGWIDRHLGIVSRRVLGPTEHVAELASLALDEALTKVGWSGAEVDGLICATSFVDDLLPATASLIARDRCPGAVAFDVNASCASVPYALAVAQSMLTAGMLDRVAVCVAERPTAWADYQDRESCVFWGDSAGVLLLQRESAPHSFAISSIALANDNAHPEKVRVRRAGMFHHDGRYSYEQVCTLTDKVASNALAAADVDAGGLAAFVGHQSNVLLLRELGDRLGVPWDRQWHNVEWAGNQGGAGVLTAFSEGWANEKDDLVDGAHVLMAAVGGGYSAGAVLLRWVDDGSDADG